MIGSILTSTGVVIARIRDIAVLLVSPVVSPPLETKNGPQSSEPYENTLSRGRCNVSEAHLLTTTNCRPRSSQNDSTYEARQRDSAASQASEMSPGMIDEWMRRRRLTYDSLRANMLEFSNATEMIDYVTAHWQGKYVTCDVNDLETLKIFR